MPPTSPGDTAELILLLSAAVLLALLGAAILLRVRVWSATGPTVRSPRVPSGSVAVGAHQLGRGANGVPAQLADWHMRGVVEVRAIEPTRAEDLRRDVSGGPAWRLELGDTAELDAEERILLAGFFEPGAAPGTVLILTQSDQSTRERIAEAVAGAIAMRGDRGTVRSFGWLAVIIRVLTVVAFVAFFVAAAAAWGPAPAAGAFFGGLVPLIATLALCVRPRGLLQPEREFRRELRSVRAYITTARDDEVVPELLGWAVLWDLPGAWSEAAPQEVLDLRWRERAFRPASSLRILVATE